MKVSSRPLTTTIGALLVGLSLLPQGSVAAPAFTFETGKLSYSESFDTQGIVASTSAYVPGWEGARYLGTGAAGPLPLIVTDGGSGTGAVYNVGTMNNTDRALGSVSSGSTVATFGASFLNSTNSTIVGLNLAGVTEQWRSGSSTAINEVYAFEISFNAASLIDTSANWISLTNFNLNEILTTTTVAAAVNGNLAANQAAISATSSGLNWTTGSTMYIRWRDTDDAGADSLLSIDNFSLTVQTGVGARTLTYNPTDKTWSADPNKLNWLNGTTPSAFANGDLVSFTDSGVTSALNGDVEIDAAGVSTGGVSVSNTLGKTYTFSGGAISGIGGLTKSNTGLLILANSGNSYSGTTTITGGELRTAADEVLPNSSFTSVTTGGLLNIGTHIETIGGLSVAGGTVQVDSGRLTFGTLSLAGGSILTGSGKVLPTANISVLASTAVSTIAGNLDFGTAARTLTVGNGDTNNNGDLSDDIDLVLSAAVSGSARVTLAGEGTIQLAGASTLAGGYRVNAPGTGLKGPTLIIANGSTLGPTEFIFNGGTLRANTDSTGAVVPVEITTPFSIGGNVNFSGTGVTLSGGFSLFGTAQKTLTIDGQLTISTITAGKTTVATDDPDDVLRKAGVGTLELSGNNSYVDGTDIILGTIIASRDGALASGPVALSPVSGTSAILRLESGTPSVSALNSSSAGSASVILGSASITSVDLVLGSARSGSYAGTIAAATGVAASLEKIGAGVQALNGSTTYTGPTVISEGTLSIGGALSGTSGVTVSGASSDAPAVLAGQGSIAVAIGGAVTVGETGQIAPGDLLDRTGTLSITATTLSLSGNLALEFGETTIGGSNANPGSSDALSLTGSLTLGANSTLTGTLLSGFTTAIGDLFFVILNDGTDAVTGRFSGIAQGGQLAIGSANFEVSYLGNSATNSFIGGNDVVLRSLTAIPEPATGTLCLAALGASLGLRRRRAA